MDFAEPHFAEPGWLWLAVLGPVALLAIQAHASRMRRRQMEQLASARFLGNLLRSASPFRRRIKVALLLLATAGIGITLARPQWGRLPGTVHTASEDVLFLLDASRSMLAEDARPNRLERARLAMLDFVQLHPGGRVGLVVFAGQAFLQCPLTFDHEAFRESLVAVNADTIPVGGTDLGRALREAQAAMEKPDDRLVMILLSDGEDLTEAGTEAASGLADSRVTLHTVGVGTPAGAEIRFTDPQGHQDVVRDEAGRVVLSRLDEATLNEIASATGGKYRPLGRLGEGLIDIQLQLQSTRAEGEGPASGSGIDRFQVPLTLVILLLVLESLISTRRNKGKEAKP